MAPKTVTQALKDMLFSLSKTQLEEFSSALLDRKEEPRVKRKDLEDKSRVDVAEVLVATYTESRAIQVALDILREIKCNDQREILAKEASEASSTKETKKDHCIGLQTFRHNACGNYWCIHGNSSTGQAEIPEGLMPQTPWQRLTWRIWKNTNPSSKRWLVRKS
ncbi:hypothetical protein F7725_005652 [Dissostichus mawsoni]|uniref:Pyrin domain-containing protein n=1 Tax=Dissostichus mawsoni TaxID=36200 RepID=A0A7J5YUX7_DISMA|nr:hypothetical protein F7725_005652 [Dissostichus mawsoni]